jgi:hypothetical protein
MINIDAGKQTVVFTRNAYLGGFQSRELRDDDEQGEVVISLRTTSVDERMVMYGMTRLRLASTSVAYEGADGVVDKVKAASMSKTSLFWSGDRPICSPFVLIAATVKIKEEKEVTVKETMSPMLPAQGEKKKKALSAIEKCDD